MEDEIARVLKEGRYLIAHVHVERCSAIRALHGLAMGIGGRIPPLLGRGPAGARGGLAHYRGDKVLLSPSWGDALSSTFLGSWTASLRRVSSAAD